MMKESAATAIKSNGSFTDTYKRALTLAGPTGHIATLPEVIEARIAAGDRRLPVCATPFVTASAEFVGLSSKGKPIAIVLHGVGPLNTLQGILDAYADDIAGGLNAGGWIDQNVFLELERGRYGDVDIVDLEACWKRREMTFSDSPIEMREVLQEPLWQARLGDHWQDYLAAHAELSRRELTGHRMANVADLERPCTIAMNCSTEASYASPSQFDQHMRLNKEMALGSLLSIGAVCRVDSHDYWERFFTSRERRISIAAIVSTHVWEERANFLVIPGA